MRTFVTSLILILIKLALAAATNKDIPLVANAPAPVPATAWVTGFEVEHRSLLHPPDGAKLWTPPVLDTNGNAPYRFAWRFAASAPTPGGGSIAARNVTQVSAVLSLTSVDGSMSTVTCQPESPDRLNLECGGGSAWRLPATRFAAKLDLVLSMATPGGTAQTSAVAQGWFVLGLPANSWGGAEWLGVAEVNSTASQFRARANVHAIGFKSGGDVARAMLFVAGLGGYRACVNGRPLDPTSVRASVTEWHNRTYYFADDVTPDLATAASGNGSVVVAVELFKHWYALANSFYRIPYGPRSFKALLTLTHTNGTTTHLIPTVAGPDGGWRHASGSLLSDDLHHGQVADGRLATPGWESMAFDDKGWAAASAVAGPPGQLRAHPMPHTRVLERVRPLNVSAVPSTVSGTTYRFTLPFEVAGFCTLMLPSGCAPGTSAEIRHGECVDPVANTLCPIMAQGTHYPNRDAYVCRGDAKGMGAHDVSWRQLAAGGHTNDPAGEAFTPAFQFNAFKYIEVSYSNREASVAPPTLSSLSCFRVGTGFDWPGDVVVAAAEALSSPESEERPLTPPHPSPHHHQHHHHHIARLTTPPRITHCGRVRENDNLTLGCADGRTIDNILFASFGTTVGNCSHGFGEGICSTTGHIGSAKTSMSVVRRACIGKSTCVVPATEENFAPGNPCRHVLKSLAVELHCSGNDAPTCQHSCYDDTHKPAPAPAPGPGPAPGPRPPSPAPTTTPAERFNAVVNATRSTAIANYVMDIPTDSPQEEKRGWTGDSLATHRTYAAFFDMRAAWVKWTEDQVFSSSMLAPRGTVPSMVPCVFDGKICRNDPRGQSLRTDLLTGMAWGSILPQLSAFTAAWTQDGRYAARVAPAAGRYVGLLQSYTNNASYAFPDLMNITSQVDGYNVGKKGWPASSYGDWCPINSDKAKGGACTSVSALINSGYFILDLEAVLALLRAAPGAVDTGDGPSEAQLQVWLSGARKSFSSAFLRQIVVQPNRTSVPSPSNTPVSGLAFRDPNPPKITHHGNPNTPPSAQAEAALGMAAMGPALRDISSTRAALGDMLAGLVLNISTEYSATDTGGVIDMAQLGRSLVSFGRPDALFALLSTDGPTSLYHMAHSTGTIWAHPGGSDGNRGKCSSHSHIMQGGSVGEAVFGIGGIRPPLVRGAIANVSTSRGGRLLLAPVPWLPDAPRGSAVWRTAAGVASTTWSANGNSTTARWSVWVNVTAPAGGGAASVRVMLPITARREGVCAWECGFLRPVGAAAFTRRWVSFGDTDGFNRFEAVVPSPSSTASPETTSRACKSVWHSGAAAPQGGVVGVVDVEWAPAQPGSEMFPALALTVGSGDYAFFARSC